VLAYVYALSGRGEWAMQGWLSHLALALSGAEERTQDAEAAGAKAGSDPAVRRPRGLLISTIHAAKGLEWNTVFIPNWVEGLMPMACRDPDKMRLGLGPEAAAGLPDSAAEMTEHREEERRLAHVAITRAQERLFISAYV
jgi:superfamily I DNA/RNA helicase